MNWTKEWPTTPGQYWFYGRRSSMRDKDDLFYVQVRKIQNGVTYICEGSFLFEAEGAKGVWQPITLPELP